MLRISTLLLATGCLCLFGATAQADLPNVTTANLIAHFQANSDSLTLDGSGNVLSWSAENNPAFTLSAQGANISNNPENIRFNPSGMGGLGTLEVNDIGSQNRFLRGPLGQALPNGATVFWVGYYDPGRNFSSGTSNGDSAGQYAYTVGRAGSQGSQLDHQIDDDQFQLYGGSGTQGSIDIDYLNGSYSVFKTNYLPTSPGHTAFANNFDLQIPNDGGYSVPANQDIHLFGWQNTSGVGDGRYNFVGNMSDFVIYDGVLDSAEAATVYNYLYDRLPADPPSPPAPRETVTLYAPLSGLPNTKVPGFVPHGNEAVTGYAEFTIYPNNTMDYNIVVNGNEYDVSQAHFYNINETSGTSGNPANGDSIICWGGRWASGGDSDEYLQGTGYSNSRLGQVIANPEDWMLIIHTEGGHFANGQDGGLIEYNPAVHETNELGVAETERPSRFNNRVGRTLLDMVLREDNTRDPNAPFYDPNDLANLATTPFADSNGNMWVEFDSNAGEYVLTAEAMSRGYDLDTTEYLFYLYDDQGPTWDFGGPEGAFGGFLTTRQIPEPASVVTAIGLLAVAAFAARRRK